MPVRPHAAALALATAVAGISMLGLDAEPPGLDARGVVPRSGPAGTEPGAPGEGKASRPWVEPDSLCRVVVTAVPLPDAVRETSGLARSGRDPRLFWTHNDAGNAPEIFAVDASGRLRGRVRVTGAGLVDWEDVEAAVCDGEPCLYLADTGDNDAEREGVTIYRVREPSPETGETAPADALHARFPDGPRDVEALFADSAGDLYLVSKGRGGPIVLYRYGEPRPGHTVVLERVARLLPEPRVPADRVTAATSTPDGRWVGIRTYRTLYLYRPRELLGGTGQRAAAVIDLSGLGQDQGEALALDDHGGVWLSSEAEDGSAAPRLSSLRCTFPAD